MITRSNLARTSAGTLIPAALLLLGGCAFDTPPEVLVRGATITEVGETQPPHLQLAVRLDLENPTEDPIQLETFEYTFRMEEGPAWSGSWSALRTLPPGETVPMEIPAVIPAGSDESTKQGPWRIEGTISYKAPGRWAQILFDTGFRRPTQSFRGRGEDLAVESEAPADG